MKSLRFHFILNHFTLFSLFSSWVSHLFRDLFFMRMIDCLILFYSLFPPPFCFRS
ncbi:hypothetical protein GGR56DRAFT_630989 [Xylariaceae sp. FL0804]|nr:hypothetical protein GGR56DRAFT_630989 [Xylariaceae sp. FL0804]